MKPENLEQLGQVIDKIDNLLAGAKLPLPPAMHVRGLTSNLTDIRQRLYDIYIESGGENAWGMTAAMDDWDG